MSTILVCDVFLQLTQGSVPSLPFNTESSSITTAENDLELLLFEPRQSEVAAAAAAGNHGNAGRGRRSTRVITTLHLQYMMTARSVIETSEKLL